LAEIDPDVIALQEITLDRLRGLIGCFEKGTDLQAIGVSLFERGFGQYGILFLFVRESVCENSRKPSSRIFIAWRSPSPTESK
jgi:hypothetical protein